MVSKPKIAILHDYLNQKGGAERVLKNLLEIFPSADLYTLFYNSEKVGDEYKPFLKKTSFLDLSVVKNNHRFFIPFMPIASDFLKSSEYYNLIISESAGYAKGFNVKGERHISYCHTPLRYAWESRYFENSPYAPKISSVAKYFRRPFQLWDKKISAKVDKFIANSSFIAQKIKDYYQREAEIIYPPVDESIFYFDEQKNSDEYYLMAGRLIYYKRFDIAISVFNRLKKKLKIVGTGPEAGKLRRLSDAKYIEFIEDADDIKLRELYQNARALIFPQIEDFGLVAAEAQMCGLPVLAFRAGGALEIIEEGKTGVFFNEQSPESLSNALLILEKQNFDRKTISNLARRFSKEVFKDKIKASVDKILNP